MGHFPKLKQNLLVLLVCLMGTGSIAFHSSDTRLTELTQIDQELKKLEEKSYQPPYALISMNELTPILQEMLKFKSALLQDSLAEETFEKEALTRFESLGSQYLNLLGRLTTLTFFGIHERAHRDAPNEKALSSISQLKGFSLILSTNSALKLIGTHPYHARHKSPVSIEFSLTQQDLQILEWAALNIHPNEVNYAKLIAFAAVRTTLFNRLSLRRYGMKNSVSAAGSKEFMSLQDFSAVENELRGFDTYKELFQDLRDSLKTAAKQFPSPLNVKELSRLMRELAQQTDSYFNTFELESEANIQRTFDRLGEDAVKISEETSKSFFDTNLDSLLLPQDLARASLEENLSQIFFFWKKKTLLKAIEASLKKNFAYTNLKTIRIKTDLVLSQKPEVELKVSLPQESAHIQERLDQKTKSLMEISTLASKSIRTLKQIEKLSLSNRQKKTERLSGSRLEIKTASDLKIFFLAKMMATHPDWLDLRPDADLLMTEFFKKLGDERITLAHISAMAKLTIAREKSRNSSSYLPTTAVFAAAPTEQVFATWVRLFGLDSNLLPSRDSILQSVEDYELFANATFHQALSTDAFLKISWTDDAEWASYQELKRELSKLPTTTSYGVHIEPEITVPQPKTLLYYLEGKTETESKALLERAIRFASGLDRDKLERFTKANPRNYAQDENFRLIFKTSALLRAAFKSSGKVYKELDEALTEKTKTTAEKVEHAVSVSMMWTFGLGMTTALGAFILTGPFAGAAPTVITTVLTTLSTLLNVQISTALVVANIGCRLSLDLFERPDFLSFYEEMAYSQANDLGERSKLYASDRGVEFNTLNLPLTGRDLYEKQKSQMLQDAKLNLLYTAMDVTFIAAVSQQLTRISHSVP